MSNLKLNVTRDRVLLCVHDLFKIKRFFEGSKDGLAVELIAFQNIFLDENYNQIPSRQNGKSLIDGELIKPVYKNELLKQIAELEEKNRLSGANRDDNYCNYIDLGKIPEHLLGKQIDAKLFYVKNKNLCTQIDYYGYCGELLYYKPSKISLKLALPNVDFKPSSNTIEFVIDVAFEKSSTILESIAIDTLVSQMKAKEFIVKKVTVDAFASIEGNKETNRMLVEKRAKKLVNKLNTFQTKKIEWSVNAKENWPLFYDQIIGAKWFYLNSLNQSKISQIINKPENQLKLELFFEKQRRAKITLLVTPKMTSRWIIKLAQAEWVELLENYDPQNPNENEIKRIEELQDFFYSSYSTQPIDVQEWIANMHVVGYSNKISTIRYRQQIFDIIHNEYYDPLESVKLLKKLNRVLKSSELDCNIKAIIASNTKLFDEKTKIPLIKSMLNQAKRDNINKYEIEELELW